MMDREALRPAFEASYLAIYSIRPQALGDGRYADREAGLRFEGFCAAMESITSDAAIERAARAVSPFAFSVAATIEHNGERIGGRKTKALVDARATILAAITPSLAEGA